MRRLLLGSGLYCGSLFVAASPAIAGVPIFDIGNPPCTEDEDCFNDWAPYCDIPEGTCEECVEDEHCTEGMQCASHGECIFACRTDADCPPRQPHCDLDDSTCQACLEDAHCGRGEYCLASSTCEPQVCTPGETFCSRGAVRLCADNGGQSRFLEQCKGSLECAKTGRGAMCLPTGGDSSGGAGTVGSTGVAGDDGTGPESTSTSGGPSLPNTGSTTGSGGDGGQTDVGVSDRGCASCGLSGDRFGGAWALLLLVGLWRRPAKRYDIASQR
ncbi:MAG: hypothetical protein AAF799_02440 [Myxococcota bacterium]